MGSESQLALNHPCQGWPLSTSPQGASIGHALPHRLVGTEPPDTWP